MQPNTILDQAIDLKRKEIQNSFLKEWKPKQFNLMMKAIARHFKMSQNKCDEWLGLAYTSSSSFAVYGVCNVETSPKKYPNYHYVGFALTNELRPYAILWDKDENEILLPL